LPLYALLSDDIQHDSQNIIQSSNERQDQLHSTLTHLPRRRRRLYANVKSQDELLRFFTISSRIDCTSSYSTTNDAIDESTYKECSLMFLYFKNM
jgi:hypothetical protein